MTEPFSRIRLKVNKKVILHFSLGIMLLVIFTNLYLIVNFEIKESAIQRATLAEEAKTKKLEFVNREFLVVLAEWSPVSDQYRIIFIRDDGEPFCVLCPAHNQYIAYFAVISAGDKIRFVKSKRPSRILVNNHLLKGLLPKIISKSKSWNKSFQG